MARVKIGFDVDRRVSVYEKGSPLQKGDYVSHYAVKGTMTVEEYASIYDNKKNYTSTPFQLRERDYTHLYSNEEYWICEYNHYTCERGIAKFMNCATPGTEEQNNQRTPGSD